MKALPNSPRVKWVFLISLLLSVVFAIASFRLLPDSNLPIALVAIAALLGFVELICEIQEKRIRLVTSRVLMVKAIRILLTITPLLILRLLAPHAIEAKVAQPERTLTFDNARGGERFAVNEAQILVLETANARLEKRLQVLERRL